MMTGVHPAIVDGVLAGEHRALARAISIIENRTTGYREVVSALHQHTGHADIIGITGSPGAGKSTLVDRLTRTYRDDGLTVGVLAIDPASPFSGGAVLGDRIRMQSNAGDMDVFFRSMSARGTLGGLSTATADAVKAMDAFGKDKVIIETVGAGQNEIDIVKTADTVVVLVPPQSGDVVQTLKAGILEIGDIFVVNKADLNGVDRLVRDLREMIGHGDGRIGSVYATSRQEPSDHQGWTPEIVETIATDGTGIPELVDTIAAHHAYLEDSGMIELKERTRYAEEIMALLREDVRRIIDSELGARETLDAFADAVVSRETDPYQVADTFIDPIIECIREGNDHDR